MGKYLVCITGASGSIYGIRTMQALAENGHEVHGIVSSWGAKVLEQETGRPLAAWLETLKIPPERMYAPHDMGALPASGSFRLDGTVIAPCSMNSIGAIASGVSLNLIHRTAEVSLKERRPLVLVPRETPLSLISLRNLTALAEAGARILPASPAFYHAPKSVDDIINFIVAKIIDNLSITGMTHNFDTSWKGFL